MHILITDPAGFLGCNLLAHLEQALPESGHVLHPLEVTAASDIIAQNAATADFVFHLTDAAPDFTAALLAGLASAKKPPVLFAAPEKKSHEALLSYSQRTGASVYLYCLPHPFGKWSLPHLNPVANLCNRLSRGLPYGEFDPETELHLTYIDDIIAAWLRVLDEQPKDAPPLCTVEPIYTIKMGELVARLTSYGQMRDRLDVPDQSDPLTSKLYATYLSFLPPHDFARTPVVHTDNRGSFTELMHFGGYGQISLNVSKPGIVKGEHWHHTKHEKFIVIQGEGVIRLRKPGNPTLLTYKVSGETRTVVDIPPGYAHNIENVGDTDLLTLMWINERFDPAAPPDACPMPVSPQE